MKPGQQQNTLHLPVKSRQFAASGIPASVYSEQAINFLLDNLTQFPDLDEVLRRAGLTRAELRKLEADDEISAATDTRREAVIATPWHFEGGDGKPAVDDKSESIRDLIEEHVETMARAAWGAVPYGYSVWETVYAKLDRGGIGINYISEKPFEWFQPGHKGELKYRPLNMPQGVIVDTRFKFFCTVREPTYRQPYGKPLYSPLYWPWFFRKMGWQFWMKYLERWGVPFLVGHTAGDRVKMSKELAKALQNAAVAVGMDDKVDTLNTTGTAHFEAFERAVTARVQKVILGQTLTTDAGGSSGKSGSFSLGQIHNEVREDRRNADLRLVTRTIQRQIDALWELNGYAAPAPRFRFEDDTGLQIDRAERDAKLVQSGAAVLTEQYLLRAYDFEPGEVKAGTGPAIAGAGAGRDPGTRGNTEEDTTGSSDRGGGSNSPEGSTGSDGSPGGSGLEAANRQGARFTREQLAVEELIDNVSLQLTSPVKADEIKQAIRAARDPEDLAERLAIVLAKSDRREFARTLERCLFAADVMGYAHAKET